MMASRAKPKEPVTEGQMMIAEVRKSNHLLAVMATKDMPQPKAISFLESAGFDPKSIAAALGITPNAVSIALHRMRKAQSSPAAKTESEPTLEGMQL